jgi:hypothetical protein
MQLITTKPTIYLVNLTMNEYLRQKAFHGEIKLRSRLEKIITEGTIISPSLSAKRQSENLTKTKPGVTKPGR